MKVLFTLSLLFFTLFSHSQATFSDDFEAYPAGAWIAGSNPKWTTWTNKPSTTEDAKVTDEKAKSGKNSLKISSTSTSGGPTDLVLPFGGKYTTGNFNFKMSLFVPTGKNAYFNFQATQTIGQTWAMDANFNTNGNMMLTRSAAPLLNAVFPLDEWFDVEFDINLTANLWKVKINGTCVGAFSNPTNSIASIDYYPTSNTSLYYMDDVSYSYNASAPKLALDGGISELTWTKGILTNTKDTPEYTFKNFGDSTIQNIEISVLIDGINMPVTINDLNLKKGQSKKLKLPEITLKEGLNTIIVTLEKVNGKSSDDEFCNNILNFIQTAVTAAPHRAVLVEEGTGPWCQWCPRGAVFMDRYSETYHGTFIPIAVHNGGTNPMRIVEYDSFMDFPGFPNCKINRNQVIDPSSSEGPFLREITLPAMVSISTGAKYTLASKELLVSTEIEFLEDATGDFNINLVLTEDGVKGTTSAYNQSNAYAGGTNGIMGGFELLPNPVPAAQMTYDHVARAISGLVPSSTSSFSGTYKKGDKVLLNFAFTLNAAWKTANMNIIPIVLMDGTYINASTSKYDEAIAKGFTVGVENTILTNDQVNIYPNPAEDMTSVQINLTKNSDVVVSLRTISGQIIVTRTYENLSGENLLSMPLQLLNSGMYLLDIKTNQGSRTEKIVIK